MIFLWGVINYKAFKTDMTMQEWMDNNNLSEPAKNAIRIVSITINDIPENTHVNDFSVI